MRSCMGSQNEICKTACSISVANAYLATVNSVDSAGSYDAALIIYTRMPSAARSSEVTHTGLNSGCERSPLGNELQNASRSQSIFTRMPSAARSSQVTHTGSYLAVAARVRGWLPPFTGRMNMTLW